MPGQTDLQEGLTWIANGQCAQGTIASFYPLVLQNYSLGREWKLKFQTAPQKAMVLEGVPPSRGEMAEALLQIQGCNLLDVFMLLAEIADKA